ncbi:MAG: 3-phosphoshikimate 1-carboxyvinyltransferase, partial [Spirochaetes bacterium]|nr:3-phosphoshikimate 1-carboxyvinyltransferase [Spirochaetota bacterium]
MKVKIKRSDTSGQVKIPSSKSHTIRAIYLASLAKGHSRIKEALISSDTRSAIEVCRSFGATIRSRENTIEIDGLEGHPGIPDDVIDVGNSGTSLRIGLSTAALINGYTVFTGDEQIKNRTLQPLMTALNNLGAQVFSIKDNGKAPVIVKGVAKGGVTELEAISSQYLSSLLINAPLFQNDTEIRLTLLNERPYVDMTLNWLDKQNIKYENDNYKTFHIKGGQAYQAFDQSIPGDFSSASFFLGLGALSDNEVILENLDMNDTQGDKLVIEYLKQMGASVSWDEDRLIIKGGKLKGARIDMNNTPDALPIMAVVACFA